MDADYDGPFLTSAFFCRDVNHRGGHFHAAYDISSSVDISGGPPGKGTKTLCNLIVSFARGHFVGELPLRISFVRPDDSVGEINIQSLLFTEGQSDATVVGKIGLQLDQPGMFWFSVYLGDLLMTRTSLKVRYLPVADLPPQNRPNRRR